MAEITKKKVNPQEPPSQISTATPNQPAEQADKETTTKNDTSASTLATKIVKDQTGKKDASISIVQTQGALSMIIDQGRIEKVKEGESPKEKEQQAI